MSITTTNIDVKDTRQRIVELRKKHQTLLERIGRPDALFIPKLAYKPPGSDSLHIAFFPSEVSKGEDIYTEFVSTRYEPEDPERCLYRWDYNPDFEASYKKTDPHPVSGSRYLVPVSELKKVEDIEIEEEDFEIPDPDSDLALNLATLRDLYAVLHNKPVSNKKWLNDLIKHNSGR